MASKRTDARKAADKRRKAKKALKLPEKARAEVARAKEALKLSEKARAEVARLLKQQQDGTITGAELETGLEEVVENLQRMLNHILAAL